MDVGWALEQLGIAELGSVAGAWAGAVVSASCVYPLTISLAGFTAPAMARGVAAIRNKLKR